jgi:ABC-type dipeptide/oligopeptide/nickel transport system ATPase component
MSLKKLETSPAITVGFFGEMGCGKSSLISLVHDSIRSTSELCDDDIQLKKFSKYRDQLLNSPLDATRDVHHFTLIDTADGVFLHDGKKVIGVGNCIKVEYKDKIPTKPTMSYDPHWLLLFNVTFSFQ